VKSLKKSIKSLCNGVLISIKMLIRTRSLREVINAQFSDANKVVVGLGVIDYVVTKNGDKFSMSKLIDTVVQAQKSYIFDDIRKDEIVIYIGASIGGFAIPASTKAKVVYAVEPLTPDLLKVNVALNNSKNIQVLDVALGDGKKRELKWFDRNSIVQTKTLTEIKSLCGGCGFLKIDCEGAEWDIREDELKGIRRIEMEVHNVGFPLSLMENRLKGAGFKYSVVKQSGGGIGLWLIHASRLV